MSHRSVVQLLEDTARSLSDSVLIGYGRRTDFNQKQNKSHQCIWFLPLTASPGFAVNDVENYLKRWNVIVVFLEKDTTDSKEDEYKPILDTTDNLVDRFVIALNNWHLNNSDTVGATTLTGFQQSPLFKDNSDIFTGWILSFTLTVPDDFNYCP